MRFGFDIDDTLINLREYAFQLYNEKLNKNVELTKFKALKTLEIHELFEMSKEEGGKMWNSLAEEIYYSSCPAFEGAVEALQALENEGHEIFYITARKAEHGERTKQWMIENGFPVKDDHFYCGMKDHEKIETIKKLELDYYFDDKPAVLETLVGIQTKVYAIDNSYNREIESIPRLTNWSELKQVISK
ncbi:5' nucleotidase, NT5C type [Peribacillus sp. NPDC046944]|uniref:5' nucleotidase, NT5C type n=1 Tax=unclassified Peribacillus TaxID=2675266 RepID=UPI003800C960